MDVELPDAADPDLYAAVIGFGCVLFVFSVVNHDIYCLDLLVTNKWYKSDKKMFVFGASIGPGVVVDGNNDVHFIRYRGYDERSCHFKFSLYDVVPDELVMVYRNYYVLLVDGWIKKEVVEELKIPNELKHLIAYFYPCFI